LILSACGCEDYDDILQDTPDRDDDDDEEEEEEDGSDIDIGGSHSKMKTISAIQTADREQGQEKVQEEGAGIGGTGTRDPILKMGVMLKKLHLDPGSFSSLIESLKTFIKSSPSSSERTILSCYVADR
jgi:hypothetical protein